MTDTLKSGESPPVKISHGSASIAGYSVGGLLALAPLLLDLLTDDKIHVAVKVALLVCGTVLLVATIIGRQVQAAVAEKSRGPAAVADDEEADFDEFEGERDEAEAVEEEPPSEHELSATFIEDPPPTDARIYEEEVAGRPADDPKRIPQDEGDPNSKS